MGKSKGGSWFGSGLVSLAAFVAACGSDDAPVSAAGGSSQAASAGHSAGSATTDTLDGATTGSGGTAEGIDTGGAHNVGSVASGTVSAALEPWPGDDSGITALGGCALAQDGQCLKPLTRSKSELCQRWNTDRPQLASTIALPAADDCDPGTTVDASIDDALRRLNLFRWISGAEPLTLDEGWNEHARACAIIQSYISPNISHYPDSGARCYTEQGYTASGQSMLAGGSINPAVAVDDLIFDTGDNNLHVLGHRQGMLNPALSQVGIGFAQPPQGMPATCVRMFDGQGVEQPAGLNGVYGFPAPGRTPWEAIAPSTYLSYDKLLEWSLTVPVDVELSAAKVQLLRRQGDGWQAVDVTFGAFTDERFHGLWIIPAPKTIGPGTYAIVVSGSSLPSFGYQLIFEQCNELPTECDVLEQDCGAGNGCYEPATPYCRKSGGIKVGEACKGWDNAECEPGAVCSLGFAGGSYCARYCDALDSKSPKSCDRLCPNLFSIDDDMPGVELAGAHCFGGIGDQCNPLAPACNGDQSCFGYDPPLCQTAGTTPVHAECDGMAAGCAPGSTCVGVQGKDKLYCQPYCDPAPGAPNAIACSTLCPDNFWPYDSFGLCIPSE